MSAPGAHPVERRPQARAPESSARLAARRGRRCVHATEQLERVRRPSHEAAPPISSACVPLDAGDVTRPGTAATGLPSACAIRAPASSPGTVLAPRRRPSGPPVREDPLAGRCAQRRGSQPHGSSRTAQPSLPRRARYSERRLAGHATSRPPAITATVPPSTSSAPACAATAIPSDSPLATVTPLAASPRARLFAISMP